MAKPRDFTVIVNDAVVQRKLMFLSGEIRATRVLRLRYGAYL